MHRPLHRPFRQIRRSLIALALLCPAWLATGARGETGTLERWLPADVGNRWAYVYARERVRETASGPEREILKGTRVDEVVGRAAGFARGSVEIHSVVRGRTEGAATETLERSRLFVLPSDGGLRVVARETPHPVTGETGLARFDPPLEPIRPGIRSGQRWPLGQEVRDGLRTAYEGEILGLQTARTPAGLYENCLVVRTVGTLSGSAELYGTEIELEEGRVTTTEWYAPGVGLVLSKSEIDQSLRLSDGTALEINEKTQFALSAVELASGATPPAAPSGGETDSDAAPTAADDGVPTTRTVPEETDTPTPAAPASPTPADDASPPAAPATTPAPSVTPPDAPAEEALAPVDDPANAPAPVEDAADATPPVDEAETVGVPVDDPAPGAALPATP